MNLSPGLLVAHSHNPHTNSGGQAAGARPSGRAWWLTAALAVTVWAGATAWQPAHAGGVMWSIGVMAPGAVVQVASAPPPMVVRQPVYVPAPPVVVYDPWARPAPVYQPSYQLNYPPNYQPYYPAPQVRHHGGHGHREQWQAHNGGWQGERGEYGVSPYGGQQRGFGHHR